MNEVVVADSLPESVEFVSAKAEGGVCEDPDANNVVFCEIETIELNDSKSVTIVVTPQKVGKIENTATTRNCEIPSVSPEPTELDPSLNEDGNIICGPEEEISEEELQEMAAIQQGITGEPQGTSAEGDGVEVQGIIGGGEEFCDFGPEAPPCDPQEDNTVTISTRVKAAPQPQPEPEPNPGGCTITGTEGKDNLVGTSGRDVICGLGGNDNIRGLGGNDVIRGGDGNDSISGGAGDDNLVGGAGRDQLTGNAGADTLDGGSGDDSLFGGPGQDRLIGGSGTNKLVQ